MRKPVVSGGPVVSRILLVGQAPGDAEPVLGVRLHWTRRQDPVSLVSRYRRPDGAITSAPVFTWRPSAAVSPAKNPTGGDRVPSPDEIQNCSAWLRREMEILRPDLVIPVSKTLAIGQFIPLAKLDALIGRQLRPTFAGHRI